MKPNNILHKPQVKANISEELVGQELFLFDKQRQLAYCLNSGAALIWFLCDGSHDIASMASEIAIMSDQPKQKILPEVQETVTQFQLLELLEV